MAFNRPAFLRAAFAPHPDEPVLALTEYSHQAGGAQLVFSTGHQVYFDLRHSQAHGDDGCLPPASAGRLINLPD